MTTEDWEASASAKIKGPTADQVWPYLADFSNLYKIFPSDVSFHVEGPEGQLGAIRYSAGKYPSPTDPNQIIVLWAREELAAIDATQRYVTYKIHQNNRGLTKFTGTMQVLPDGDDGCIFKWSVVSAPVAGATYDQIAEKLLQSRTHLATYLNQPIHHTSLPRECIRSFSGRYNDFGVSSIICGQKLGIGYRPYVTRCGISRASCDKIYRSSLLRVIGLEGSHMLHYRRGFATQVVMEQKSRKIFYYLTGLVFAMVGLTYASVPLYRRFCQATGYGGTVQRKESVEEKIARHSKDGTVSSREIVVQFNADVADGMQWKFTPTQRQVRVKPGESALAFYTAENKSMKPMTGVSTYNVTPMKAAIYFNKIQCFCFEEQRLLPGEQIDMPVFFYIDPEFETDPKMDGINNIISYRIHFLSTQKRQRSPQDQKPHNDGQE